MMNLKARFARKMLSCLLLICCLFLLSGIANAAVVKASVYGTIIQIEGDEHQLALNDRIHIFDVEYNNVATLWTWYNGDGSYKNSSDLSVHTGYKFIDDAVFQLSPDMLRYLSVNGGAEMCNAIIYNHVGQQNRFPEGFNNYQVSTPYYYLEVSDGVGSVFDYGEVTSVISGNTSLSFLKFKDISAAIVGTTPTPIPTTMSLLGFGLLGLAGVTRRKQQ